MQVTPAQGNTEIRCKAGTGVVLLVAAVAVGAWCDTEDWHGVLASSGPGTMHLFTDLYT